MSWWVASTPDYQWPPVLRRFRSAPRRCALALSFHLARLIGWLARTLRSCPPAVLVIRTDGIGDALLFEPALRSLAARFTGRQLHLWAPDSVCELFSGHPAVGRLLAIPRGTKAGNLGYFRSLRWRIVMGYRLARWKFDVAVYAVSSPEPLGNWLLVSACTTERWYASGDRENQFEWQQQATARQATTILTSCGSGVPPVHPTHELLRNDQFAHQWGATASLIPQVHASESFKWLAMDQLRTWRKLADAVGATALIGLMPGSATSVSRYPIESWVQIIRGLWTTHRAMCLLLGAAADCERLAQISAAAPDVPHVWLPPGMHLLTTAAIVAELQSLISVDTGLAHIGLAQDVPTVVLRHGGHPGRFFPWPVPTRSIVLNHPVDCEGCRCRCIKPEPLCITRVTPDEVLAAYARLIRSAQRAAA